LNIDGDIKTLLDNDKYGLAWIPYEFKSIKEIGRGGFATVYSATWKRTVKNTDPLGTVTFTVALKKSCKSDYLNE
ncbi:12672_t:CDS:1, partial [Ambispora leptoticha]